MKFRSTSLCTGTRSSRVFSRCLRLPIYVRVTIAASRNNDEEKREERQHEPSWDALKIALARMKYVLTSRQLVATALTADSEVLFFPLNENQKKILSVCDPCGKHVSLLLQKRAARLNRTRHARENGELLVSRCVVPRATQTRAGRSVCRSAAIKL